MRHSLHGFAVLQSAGVPIIRNSEKGSPRVRPAPASTGIATSYLNQAMPDSLMNRQKFLAFSDWVDSVGRMVHSGFLSDEDRKALTPLARDGSSPCTVTRRANALVLLDEGMSCQCCCMTTTRSVAGTRWLARPGCRIKAAFHPDLLSASQSNRAAMGLHAPRRNAQQMLCDVRSIRRCDAELPA
jgi:hypothetical protein